MTPAKVTLREPIEADAEVHFRAPISPEIHLMYGGDPGHLPERSWEWSNNWLVWLKSQPFGRIILSDGRPVGEVRLHSLDEDARTAKLAIGMFLERDLGLGIGRRAVTLALEHGFLSMGLNAVELRVLSFNHRAIRCYQACGFRQIGIEKDVVRIDGISHDDLVMRRDA